jgi:hypothetical protein
MQTKLLVATALAAVLTGSGFAAAQDQHKGNAAPAAKSAPAPHAAPAPRASAPSGPPRAAVQHAPSAAPRAQSQIQRSAPVRSQAQIHEQGREFKGRSDREFRGRVGQSERFDRRTRAEERSGRVERNRQSFERDRVRNRETQGFERDRNRETFDRDRRERDRTGSVETRRSSASLSSEQRTRIRQVILSGRHGPRISRPGFDIRVGYRIPRNRLHFALLPLPSTIVDIEPSWQGYLYFLVGDEIVVVDPDTYEIVAVLPA